MEDKQIHELHKRIVRMILESDINIDIIPDEIEEQIYLTLLEVIYYGTKKKYFCC